MARKRSELNLPGGVASPWGGKGPAFLTCKITVGHFLISTQLLPLLGSVRPCENAFVMLLR